jgi:hypothetical protein
MYVLCYTEMLKHALIDVSNRVLVYFRQSPPSSQFRATMGDYHYYSCYVCSSVLDSTKVA